jgi:hypothetical protein
MPTFNPLHRPDLHARFLQVCAAEAARHAAHLKFIKALGRSRPRGWFWRCPECQSVYLVRGGEARCRRDDGTGDGPPPRHVAASVVQRFGWRVEERERRPRIRTPRPSSPRVGGPGTEVTS